MVILLSPDQKKLTYEKAEKQDVVVHAIKKIFKKN